MSQIQTPKNDKNLNPTLTEKLESIFNNLKKNIITPVSLIISGFCLYKSYFYLKKGEKLKSKRFFRGKIIFQIISFGSLIFYTSIFSQKKNENTSKSNEEERLKAKSKRREELWNKEVDLIFSEKETNKAKNLQKKHINLDEVSKK